MSIWNKILIGFIFVASLVFFFFAARTLKTHSAWRQSVVGHEAAIAAAEEQLDEIMEGESAPQGKMGIRQLKLELEEVGRFRPRIWPGCAPRNVDPATGAVTVAVDSPSPHQIAVKTVLYVFDDNDIQQGGRYLGQFVVSDVAEKQVVLQPGYKMTPAEITRLQRAKAPWGLYQSLPGDSRELFANWDEATKKAMLPAATLTEYLQDGQSDKPPRKLRDYDVIFKSCLRQRSEMLAETEAAARDLEYLTAAVKDAEEQRKAYENLVAKLKTELASMQDELKLAAAHNKAVEEKLAQIKAGVEDLINQNRGAAAEIARIQLEATRQIDERTRRMVRAGSGQ